MERAKEARSTWIQVAGWPPLHADEGSTTGWLDWN
jgi:hypothetical protein